MKMITTKDNEEVAKFVSSSISVQLNSGKKVLFLISGGSCLPIIVRIAEIIKESPHENLIVMLMDERYGDIEHSDSNWYQLMQKGFNLPQARLIPTLTGDDMITTANKFSEALNKGFQESDYKIGLFGIGPDGHTAGILPGSDAVNCQELVCSYVTPTYSRITMTFKAIEKLDEAVVFAQGENKWEVLKNLEKDIPLDIQPSEILKKVPLLTIFTDYKG
jgi:6-phosphogluconolactonase/glucosamine-6-phosphate isomerase/deaminase